MYSPEFLTPKEVAVALRLTERGVVAGSLRHELPWLRIGGRLRVRMRDLDAWVRRQGAPTNGGRHAA